MAQRYERQPSDQEETHGELIRSGLVNLFGTNYDKPFEEGSTVKKLLVVKFAPYEDMEILLRAGEEEFKVKYGEIDRQIEAKFDKDRDRSQPEFNIYEHVVVAPFEGMPPALNDMVGDRVLQRLTLYKLKPDFPKHRKMVVRTRIFEPDLRDIKGANRPRLEFWQLDLNRQDRVTSEDIGTPQTQLFLPPHWEK